MNKNISEPKLLLVLFVTAAIVVGTCGYVVCSPLDGWEIPSFCHKLFLLLLIPIEIALGFCLYRNIYKTHFENQKWLSGKLSVKIVLTHIIIGNGLLTILRCGWPTWHLKPETDAGLYLLVTGFSLYYGLSCASKINRNYFKDDR